MHENKKRIIDDLRTITNRSYEVYAIENSQGITISAMDLGDFFTEDTEVCFALKDILDLVLDLKIGESMYFQPSRADVNSKGVILRKT